MARSKVRYSKKKNPKLSTEKQVHKAVCNYLRMVCPKVIFFSDMSGLKTSIGVAMGMKALRSGRAIPDLFIASPQGEYSGLFIEIKSERSDVWKVDGTIRTNGHILEQAAMLDKLQMLGYHAVFGCGQDECQKIIEEYFKQDEPLLPLED